MGPGFPSSPHYRADPESRNEKRIATLGLTGLVLFPTQSVRDDFANKQRRMLEN